MDVDIWLYTVDEKGKEADQGRVRAGVIVMSWGDQPLTVEDVESVLGAPVEISDAYKNENPRHPSPIQPTTHRLGNKGLNYPYDSPTARGNIGFLINGDGTVNRYTAFLEVK